MRPNLSPNLPDFYFKLGSGYLDVQKTTINMLRKWLEKLWNWKKRHGFVKRFEIRNEKQSGSVPPYEQFRYGRIG
jgi:hypothetical protein